jgi:nucleoside-diphosphate-sugar epimerase
MNRIALVIGATGGIGGETARALLENGWRVRALHRAPERAREAWGDDRIEWVRGDAMNAADVDAAAEGVSAIVHAANPPGYKNWKGLVLPMLESSIAAATRHGARLVLPGTVYNYGPDAPAVVDEATPQRPATRKGKIRVAMEDRLRAASEQGLRVLIVRAGDFFGPRAGNNWFSQGFVRPGSPVRSVTYPGPHEHGHAFAYLPDLATTIVRLLDRSADLGTFEVFHFRGHSFERGVELAEATLRVAGGNGRVRSFPWLFMYVLAPFVETFREMIEMRYLWSRTMLLDNRKLVAFLGSEPHTPTDEALRATLAGLGCQRSSGAGTSHARRAAA